MPLSPRLQLLHDAMRPGFPAFDLCCDHGFLGIGALLSERVPHVTFVDRVPALVDKVCDRFPVALDKQRATFVAADAATLLVRPVEGTIVIAGVGATIALAIVDAFAHPSLEPLGRILLQPESKSDDVRKHMLRLGYRVNVRRVADNGSTHSVLLCAKDDVAWPATEA